MHLDIKLIFYGYHHHNHHWGSFVHLDEKADIVETIKKSFNIQMNASHPPVSSFAGYSRHKNQLKIDVCLELIRHNLEKISEEVRTKGFFFSKKFQFSSRLFSNKCLFSKKVTIFEV